MQGASIAVVEDERVIADAVAARLRKEGFEVETAADGPGGIELCRTLRPDAVVLDLMLPGVDGLEVCKQIQRDRNVPVLMLTARDSEADLLVGLGVGADDYMTKPFSMQELVARLRALLRRAGAASDQDEPKPLNVGDLTVDPATRETRIKARRRPDPARVRPPAPPGPAARRGAQPRAAAARGLGLRGRDGRAHRGLPHPRPAAQARPRRDPHRSRRGLRRAEARAVMGPLDHLHSIKLKIGAVIVAAVLVSAGVVVVAAKADLPLWLAGSGRWPCRS